MISRGYVQLMAAYNEWQNRNLYGAASGLGDAERKRDRGAFYGSIHATLNHILWGDQLWLSRFADTPMPDAKGFDASARMYADWDALQAARIETDGWIIDWARDVNDDALSGNLSWFSGAAQQDVTRPRWPLVVQLFNHGTHHRGQVHAMLTAAGARPGDTDVQYLDSPSFDWSRVDTHVPGS